MKYTAHDVNEMLKERVEEFCQAFLRGGSREGRFWRCGDVYGNSGSSFVVHLEGSRKGQFFENGADADPKVKTLLDVYMKTKNYEQDRFRDALYEMKQWLGLKEDASGFRRMSLQKAKGGSQAKEEGYFDDRLTRFADGERPAVSIRVDWQDAAGTAAEQYLAEERALVGAAELCARYRLGYCETWYPGGHKRVPSIVYPSWDSEGKACLNAKFKSLARYWRKGPLAGKPEATWREVYPDFETAVEAAEGQHPKRLIRAVPKAPKHLIGMHACVGSEVIIAEGEEDMLSWAAEGKDAVSVPFGAKGDKPDGTMNGDNEWITNDWPWLMDKQDLIVAMDADAEGRKAAHCLSRRLGTERVLVAMFPQEGDDANRVYQRDANELHDVYESAQAIDPEDLARVTDFKDEVWDLFFPADGEEPGYEPPFAMPFRFRPGEVTVWTGYSKHGKTICQTYTIIDLLAKGCRACVASLEIRPAKTLQNAARMAMGKPKPGNWRRDHWEPDPNFWNQTVDWLNNRLWFYSHLGEADLADVLKVFKYAARRYGCNQFVLDSIMKLSVSEEDYQGHKQVMNAIMGFAIEYQVHVHVVAHSKKGDATKRPEERFAPRKHDVSGSAHITNICDNVVIIWRNKQKEMELQNEVLKWERMEEGEGKAAQSDKIDRIYAQPDAHWIVAAQRHGAGEEPIKHLWFDKGAEGSWQYFDTFEKYNEATRQGRRCYVLES